MKQVFGACVTSLITVQNLAERRYGASDVVVYTSTCDASAAALAKIVLIPSLSEFKKSYEKLDDFSGVGVIFDSALSLQEVKNLKFLDLKNHDRSEALSYCFVFSPFDQAKLFKAVDTTSRKRFKFTRYKKSLLPHIIEARANGEFCEVFYNYLYCSTSHSIRDVLHRLVYSIFFANKRLTQARGEMHRMLEMNEPRKRMIGAVIGYLESERGKKLQAAAVAAVKHISTSTTKTGKRKPVPYKKLLKEFQVNKYDLRFVVKLWREQHAQLT